MKKDKFVYLCDMEPGKAKEDALRERIRHRINGRYLTTKEKSLLFYVLREDEKDDSKDRKPHPSYSKGKWLLNEVDYYVRPKEPTPSDEAFHSLGKFLLSEIDRKVEADFERQKKERREKIKRTIMKVVRKIRRK